MTEHKNQDQEVFKLPHRLVSSVDLARVTRELKLLDDWFNQNEIRDAGKQANPPKTSTTLEELASSNGVSVLDKSQRSQLIGLLDNFIVNAPKIHIAFAVEPSVRFLNEMIIWLRSHINPVILLEVGLQPALAAGCSVRTTNKLFDMSLRNHFRDSRHLLYQSIKEFGQDKSPGGVSESPQAQTPIPTKEAPSEPAQTAAVPMTSQVPAPTAAQPVTTEVVDAK